VGFLGREGVASPSPPVGGNYCLRCLSALCKSLNHVNVRIRSYSRNTVLTKKMWHQQTLIIPTFFLTNNVCSLISVLKMYIPKSRRYKTQGVPSASKVGACPRPLPLRPWLCSDSLTTAAVSVLCRRPNLHNEG